MACVNDEIRCQSGETDVDGCGAESAIDIFMNTAEPAPMK
jgi:hypothetical protein